MKRQRLVVVCSGYYLPHLGGVETYVNKLAEELLKNDYKVIIITSNHGNLPSEEKMNGVQIYRLPTYKLFKQRYPLFRRNREYKNLMAKLLNKNIDYVICNTRFHLTSFIGAKIAQKKNIPVLLIEHGSSHFSINNKLLDGCGEIYEHILTNAVKRKIQTYYGVSERCNQWLGHFSIKAEGVFYNSVDEEDYNKFKTKHYLNKGRKILITYAGRIIKEKGVEELLRAYAMIVNKYPNTLLVVAGDGPLLMELKQKYEGKHIRFLGKLDHNEIMALYNDTDIFVYPSMFPEGLPTSILEAGLMKCAVIATDRGGTTEVINQPKYGMIVKENINSIKKHLCELLDDPNKIMEMGSNLHERIRRKFTWSVTVQKIIDKMEE